MRTWLIDTGPLVAYLNARDHFHGQVVKALAEFTGQLATTNAVISEAMYFLSGDVGGARLLAKFIGGSRTVIYDFCQAPKLLEAALLMERYADAPMDFADATLVLLAEGLGVADLATLDRRGFLTYRFGGRKAFRLVLD